jgi:hypothetical protein
MKKDDEPDFYKMDKENPLPSVEDAPIPSGITPEATHHHLHHHNAMAASGGYHPSMTGIGGGGGMHPTGLLPPPPRFGGGGFDDYANPMGTTSMYGTGPHGMSGHIMSMNGSAGMPGMMSSMGGAGAAAGGGPSMMHHSMMHHHGISPTQRAILAQEQRALLGMEMSGGPMSMGLGGGMSHHHMAGGMGSLRESQFGASAAAAGDMEYQRLRHIQQMQMLDLQMGSSSMPPMGGDPLDRMRSMEMRLGR